MSSIGTLQNFETFSSLSNRCHSLELQKVASIARPGCRRVSNGQNSQKSGEEGRRGDEAPSRPGSLEISKNAFPGKHPGDLGPHGCLRKIDKGLTRSFWPRNELEDASPPFQNVACKGPCPHTTHLCLCLEIGMVTCWAGAWISLWRVRSKQFVTCDPDSIQRLLFGFCMASFLSWARAWSHSWCDAGRIRQNQGAKCLR
jgi:hypothetical protein